MKTLEITLLALLFLAVTGCVTNQQNSASSNMSDFKNPDPKIEAMHLKAYNMDLGIGVPQDRVKANELYLQAALAGDPRSMLNLGVNLIDGEGIKKDEIEGIAWLEVARLNGSWDQGSETSDWMQFKTPGVSDYNYPAINQPNDNEDAVLRLHSGVRGDRAADWGDPGMNHGTKDTFDDSTF